MMKEIGNHPNVIKLRNFYYSQGNNVIKIFENTELVNEQSQKAAAKKQISQVFLLKFFDFFPINFIILWNLLGWWALFAYCDGLRARDSLQSD